MEPFCFVILNTNHWHNGMDEVRDWINDFSEQLYVINAFNPVYTQACLFNEHPKM